MAEIEDIGTFWVQGTFSPDQAVRVGEKIFVVGQEKDEEIEYWLEGEFLCVDRHDKARKKRIANRINLNLPPSSEGSHFKGFTHTTHSDTRAVTVRDPGVDSFIVEGGDYVNTGVAASPSKEFWERSGLKTA